MTKIFNLFFNLLFPAKCCVCGRIISDPVCPDCALRIRKRAESEINPPLYVDTMLVYGLYEGVLRKIIKKLKFGKKKRAADFLASEILKIISGNERICSADMIIPIPLHIQREKERGFNQSELIASLVAESLQIENRTDILHRIKNTGFMYKLKRDERTANVEGVFSVGKSQEIKGKSIILIDDILTTGSTISSAAGELKKNGAKAVYAICAAHAVLA